MASVAPDEANEPWRSLGSRLAAYRRAGGYTQQSLADHEAVHYGRSTIANVERGRQSAGRHFWESCDAALGTDGTFAIEYDRISRTVSMHRLANLRNFPSADVVQPLALPAARPRLSAEASIHAGESLAASTGQEDTGGMLRRTVLLALATAGGVAMGKRAAALPSGGSDHLFMTADVDHWQETSWEYGYAYHVVPREQLLAELSVDLTAIKKQLADYLAVGDVRAAPLAAVSAQFSALMAMICTDLGYPRESRHLWRFARRYANISQDGSLRLWISGHEITSGIYQQRPLAVLANLGEQALSSAGDCPPSAGRAELLGGLAQVLSLMGRNREAKETLDGLRNVFNDMPSSVTGLPDSIFGWPEHRLRHAESFTCSMTGHTAHAYAAQAVALRLYPQTQQIGRCQIELHRARCLIVDGEIREGLRAATAALAGIDESKRKEFVLAVADHVSEAIPEQHRFSADALELHELLRSSRALPGR